MCVFLLPAMVTSVHFFPFPSFGAVHEVATPSSLGLCRSMHPCCYHIMLAGLHQLCSRSLMVCLAILLRHLEGIIERRRGLGFATPQSVHGVG